FEQRCVEQVVRSGTHLGDANASVDARGQVFPLCRRFVAQGPVSQELFRFGAELGVLGIFREHQPPPNRVRSAKPRSSMNVFNLRRASCTRHATVPSGQPSTSPASAWLSPSTHTRTRVVRSVSLSPSSPSHSAIAISRSAL